MPNKMMMISKILEQQQALTQVPSANKKLRHLIPTWQNTDVLEFVSKSLGPMLDFTDALSGGHRPEQEYKEDDAGLPQREILTRILRSC